VYLRVKTLINAEIITAIQNKIVNGNNSSDGEFILIDLLIVCIKFLSHKLLGFVKIVRNGIINASEKTSAIPLMIIDKNRNKIFNFLLLFMVKNISFIKEKEFHLFL
jgi:hypothetical protein